ncbi:hypothetical protein Tco_1550030, partial [Tanacetum coccineum]
HIFGGELLGGELLGGELLGGELLGGELLGGELLGGELLGGELLNLLSKILICHLWTLDSKRHKSRDFHGHNVPVHGSRLQKQLDNEEFQENGSMSSFKVLETQFQMFINSQIYLNDEYIVMTRNYFLQYTQLDIPEFYETLVQFMKYVKKSIDERALHKMEYDSRVNERETQTTVEKVDTSKELDASLVIIESNGTESQEQDTNSRSGNDADIRPIDNEEPMAEVQTTSDDNVSATG